MSKIGKCITATLLLLSLSSTFAAQSAKNRYRIIPRPKLTKKGKGYFLINAATRLYCSDKVLGDYFVQEAKGASAARVSDLKIQPLTDRLVFLMSSKSPASLTKQVPGSPAYPGGYSMLITRDGIGIKGHDLNGLRYGIQSLLQLIEQSSSKGVPCLMIKDLPDMDFRGFYLLLRPPGAWGVRGFDEAKVVYDWLFRRMGRYKYNYVMISPKGQMEFKKHPEVRINPKYTQKEVKILLEMARYHGLEVIPEIRSLGKFFHGQPKATLKKFADMVERRINIKQGAWKKKFHSAWSSRRLASEQKVAVRTGKGLSIGLNIANPKVLPLVTDCIDEIYEVFGKPKFFAVGGDESWDFGTSWPKEVDRGKKLAEYFNALNRHLRKKGSRTIMWGDMLLSHLQFPYFFECHGGPPMNTASAIKYLDKDIILSDWHYGYTVGGVYPEHYPTLSWLRQNGFNVIAVPWYKTDNICNIARDAAATDCMGIMGTSFALHVAFQYYLGRKKTAAQVKKIKGRSELKALAATAEAAWSPVKALSTLKTYNPLEWEKDKLKSLPFYKKK
jgi:Glycosyl hydrolase family 20, domain 2/Glycosyl hydrolase family 20, catalytic domain